MPVLTEDGGSPFQDLWRAHRPFLISLAFRMLGNIGDAEDVVQEAFTRLLRVDLDEIEDARGWLVVVVSRMCLDVLRSARVRRDGRSQVGADTERHEDRRGQATDPADRVTLDDDVRIALLAVMEKLSPAERAVFVLHDVFRYPFGEIASILGRPTDTCRKLASRARQRVATAAGPSRFAIEPPEHRAVAEQFIAACAGGDLSELMRLLHADVAGQVELGDRLVPAPPVIGRDDVAHSLLFFFGANSGVTMVSQPMNGWPGALAFKGGRLFAIVSLETSDGLIVDIHSIRNPRTLAAVGRMVDARR